jgi:hypothetical protein
MEKGGTLEWCLDPFNRLSPANMVPIRDASLRPGIPDPPPLQSNPAVASTLKHLWIGQGSSCDMSWTYQGLLIDSSVKEWRRIIKVSFNPGSGALDATV